MDQPTQENTLELEHSSVMGGSNAEQRIHCPGSLQLEKQVPKDGDDSEFAMRGSVLHAAMELLIIENFDEKTEAEQAAVLSQLEGQMLMPEYGEDFAITREWIDTKIVPALAIWLSVIEQYKLVDWFIEQRCSLNAIVPGAFGTVDILAIDEDGNLHVLDWKFGDGVLVSPNSSYQLGFYAGCALYDEDPEVIEFCEHITDDHKIFLHIVQPRENADPDDFHDVWETDVAWVEQLVDQAQEASALARGDNPPVKTGTHCRWCRAQAICPEMQKTASAAIGKKPETMDAVQLSSALKMADTLKSWITAVYDLAQRELEAGAQVPAYKLVQKRATRKWIDEAQVAKAMRAGRLKAADIYEKKLISPAKAEKLDGKIYADKLEPLVELRSSGLTVVSEKDKRPAVTSSMELLGEALPAQPQKEEVQKEETENEEPKVNRRAERRRRTH